MPLVHTPDGGIRAVMMCEDPILSRLLEIELSRCGVRISDETEATLYMWDLDSVDFDPAFLPEGARLICWSTSASETFPVLSDMEERIYFLHRPFSLDALEACILLSVAPVTQPSANASALSATASQKKAYVSPVSHLILTEKGVRFHDTDIPLTPRELALFRCLWEHRGALVSKDVLREALDAAGNEAPTTNTLEVYIYHLRRKIEKPMGRRLITTERGKGYRWEMA